MEAEAVSPCGSFSEASASSGGGGVKRKRRIFEFLIASARDEKLGNREYYHGRRYLSPYLLPTVAVYLVETSAGSLVAEKKALQMAAADGIENPVSKGWSDVSPRIQSEDAG
jgi:hypothetical protein